ncbi:16026_t:CDS:1, partial [Acaulospora morrowiae]
DDGNDNMEASTSTAKNDSAIGSMSQTKPNDNSAENLAKPEFMSFSSLIAKAEAEEKSSNPTVNSTGVLSFEENTIGPLVKNQTEELTIQIDSIKPESTDMNVGSSSTSSTAAIPIPQSSQRARTPILSPASLMAKNLNPLASVFIPRSQSYNNSTSTSALVQGAIDKLNEESTEMGGTRRPFNNEDNEDDNHEFVYPGVEDESESKSEDGEFVYMPHEEDEGENIEFTYPYKDTNADKDDDESKTESSSDVNKKDILTKNGESNSSPNILGSMDNVITKVGKSTDNSITVRINNAISKDA